MQNYYKKFSLVLFGALVGMNAACAQVAMNTPYSGVSIPKMEAKAHMKKTKPVVLETKLNVAKTTVKQGEFFVVTIENARARPTVWFNTLAYRTFKHGDKYRTLIPAENLMKPGSYSIKARAGSWTETLPVKVLAHGKEVQQITLTDDKDGITATRKELNAIGAAFKTKSDEQLWDGKFMLPSTARKSSPFGVPRSYNKGPVESYHKGLDFAGNHGSLIVAPADGKVIVAGKEAEGFHVHGNTIILDHGHGVTSIYMHMNSFDVKEGDMVTKGQKLGTVGHTGISTGPHLHWGVYVFGTSVDPNLFVNNSI